MDQHYSYNMIPLISSYILDIMRRGYELVHCHSPHLIFFLYLFLFF